MPGEIAVGVVCDEVGGATGVCGSLLLFLLLPGEAGVC